MESIILSMLEDLHILHQLLRNSRHQGSYQTSATALKAENELLRSVVAATERLITLLEQPASTLLSTNQTVTIPNSDNTH
ncbi:hypothetical protein CLV59_101198 [Chitinophaga dinghuensis]|uniref:Uncharacterized protein n=1 Tax=Chitinophaga dinghuensis TaxID=1539050 RepID=A0A327W9R4_9BACT|nr:hypothetical protein [Chitinophaga dinghuensis]RAJ87447.1 hypothetical protein CLV59_101198 [Chitinophaga dinghuensis]